jgi:hypothetical protein
MHKLSAFVAAVSAVLTLPCAAAQTVSCESINNAISANEDFVEIVLSGTQADFDSAQKNIRSTLASVSSSLAFSTKAQAESAMVRLERAMVIRDISKAALAAMDNYSVLVEAFEDRLPTTRDVAMLDHAGFVLLALLAAKPVNWATAEATATAVRHVIQRQHGIIKDKALLDLLNTLSAGLVASSVVKNRDWLSSYAQMLLDSVDLIERNTNNLSSRACH